MMHDTESRRLKRSKLQAPNYKQISNYKSEITNFKYQITNKF